MSDGPRERAQPLDPRARASVAKALSVGPSAECDNRPVAPSLNAHAARGTRCMEPTRTLESTLALLERIRVGDATAREQLIGRYLPILRSWAHGRLPVNARGLADTDDVVQVTLVRALSHLKSFEYRHEGAFLGYLRQGVLNAIRQEIRRSRRRPAGEGIDESVADRSPSVVERAVGRETLERYERALMGLTRNQREAAMLRLEFGMSYPEIADAMGKSTANAARMLVVRAVVHLAEHLGRE